MRFCGAEGGTYWAGRRHDLAPGRHEVYVHIPRRYSTRQHERYWISRRDGLSLRPVDQAANRGSWVSHGTFSLRGTAKDYVSLTILTFPPYLSRLITFKADKWAAR